MILFFLFCLGFNEATSFLSSAGITALIDFCIKAIERRITKKRKLRNN
jgi:transcriptional regulator GlxA family with amidase domain